MVNRDAFVVYISFGTFTTINVFIILSLLRIFTEYCNTYMFYYFTN